MQHNLPTVTLFEISPSLSFGRGRWQQYVNS